MVSVRRGGYPASGESPDVAVIPRQASLIIAVLTLKSS